LRGRQPARRARADPRAHGRRPVRRRAHPELPRPALRRRGRRGPAQHGRGHLPPRRPHARPGARRRSDSLLLPDAAPAGAHLGARSARTRDARRACGGRAGLLAVWAGRARCPGGGIVVKHSIAPLVILSLTLAGAAAAQPTRSSPLAVAPDGHVFVVNPDSNTVARLEFDVMHQGTLTHEAPVGKYPRTLALAGPYVFTADQNSDTVSRLDQADLRDPQPVNPGLRFQPYRAAPVPGGGGGVVTCQGTSEAVLLGPDLGVVARVSLPWPNARAIAVSSNGATAYITHFITAEPSLDAHVSVVDLAQKSVAKVLSIPPDEITCETQNSGQGVFNLISAIALMPDGAPAAVANQLWVGGEQENAISKGLFKRWAG